MLCLEPTLISIHTLLKYPQRIGNYLRGKYKFRKVYDNIYTFPMVTVEHILFSARCKPLMKINKILVAKQIQKAIRRIDPAIKENILVLQRPELYFLQEMINIKASVYDCCDDFCITLNKYDWKLKGNFEREKLMAERCSFVMASSDYFYQRNIKYNPKTFIVENGFSSVVFNNTNHSKESANLNKEFFNKLKRPVIGLVGNIRHWIDFDLVEYLITQRPLWTFLFVGRVWSEFGRKYEILEKGYENLIVTGYVDYSLFPVYLSFFDAGIIPYKQNEFTKSVNPNKLFEYLGAQVPVVSTDIGDIGSRYKDAVMVARSKEEFLAHLEGIVSMTAKQKVELKSRISAVSKECTWENSAKKFYELCEKYIYN